MIPAQTGDQQHHGIGIGQHEVNAFTSIVFKDRPRLLKGPDTAKRLDFGLARVSGYIRPGALFRIKLLKQVLGRDIG